MEIEITRGSFQQLVMTTLISFTEHPPLTIELTSFILRISSTFSFPHIPFAIFTQVEKPKEGIEGELYLERARKYHGDVSTPIIPSLDLNL